MARMEFLTNEIGRLNEESNAMVALCNKENRAMTAEESAKWDAMDKDIAAHVAEKARLEKQAERNAFLNASAGRKTGDTSGGATADADPTRPWLNGRTDKDLAFLAYMRGGREGVPGQFRNALQQDSDIGGGYFSTSSRLVAGILKNLDNRIPLRGAATTFQVKRGESLGVISLDSDITDFEWGAGELTTASKTDVLGFGKRELKVRDLKSKIVLLSDSLIANATIDVEAQVASRVAYSLGNTQDKAFMTGDGNAQPLGLFTASANGIPTSRDVVTGSATGITTTGLYNAQDAVRNAYNCQWMFSQAAISKIRQLSDGISQPFWQPGLQLGQPALILGKPYIIAENCPSTFTNGLYFGMYGDFSYYYIADATNMVMQRLVELYAETNQVGLKFAGLACDGMPVLAEAFARLKCAAA